MPNYSIKHSLLLLSLVFISLFLIQCTPNSYKNQNILKDESQMSLDEIKSYRLNLFRSALRPDGTLNIDSKKGQDLYMENCYACHDVDGQKILFGHKDNKRSLAMTAANNPEVFYLMANFGEEKRRMLAYYQELSAEELLAITAYVQTLPQKLLK